MFELRAVGHRFRVRLIMLQEVGQPGNFVVDTSHSHIVRVLSIGQLLYWKSQQAALLTS